MKIAISTLGADGGVSGLSTYARQMVRWLPRVAPEHTFEVLRHEDEDWMFEPGAPPLVDVPVTRLARPSVAGILWHLLALPRLAARRGWDAVLFTAGNRRLPGALPCASVGTVHDLASFHMPLRFGAWRGRYVRAVLPKLIARLDEAIVLSAGGQADVERFCGLSADRISVVPQAADTERFRPGSPDVAREAVRLRHGIHAPYLLYVSRVEHPSKNHVRLIDALARVKAACRTPHQIVCVGADRERAAEVHAHLAASPVARDVKFLGFVSDDHLVDLYHAAEGVVFPSLFEGFGLPVLEAMSCGLPVACSNTSALPGVAGPDALYFDPHDTASIAAAMGRLMFHTEERERLSRRSRARALAFSWEATARRTADVLERAVRRRAGQLVGASPGGVVSPRSLSFSRSTL